MSRRAGRARVYCCSRAYRCSLFVTGRTIFRVVNVTDGGSPGAHVVSRGDSDVVDAPSRHGVRLHDPVGFYPGRTRRGPSRRVLARFHDDPSAPYPRGVSPILHGDPPGMSAPTRRRGPPPPRAVAPSASSPLPSRAPRATTNPTRRKTKPRPPPRPRPRPSSHPWRTRGGSTPTSTGGIRAHPRFHRRRIQPRLDTHRCHHAGVRTAAPRLGGRTRMGASPPPPPLATQTPEDSRWRPPPQRRSSWVSWRSWRCASRRCRRMGVSPRRGGEERGHRDPGGSSDERATRGRGERSTRSSCRTRR